MYDDIETEETPNSIILALVDFRICAAENGEIGFDL